MAYLCDMGQKGQKGKGKEIKIKNVLFSVILSGNFKNKKTENFLPQLPHKVIDMKRKTYYRTCKYCGSNLDPGEKCDCQKERDQDGDQAKEPTFSGIQNVYAVSGMAGKEETETMDR